MAVKTAHIRGVSSSTNAHRICAIGHACAADAHQWSELYVYKTSGSKRIDGRRVWGSPFSHIQLLPNWLAHGGASLLPAAK